MAGITNERRVEYRTTTTTTGKQGIEEAVKKRKRKRKRAGKRFSPERLTFSLSLANLTAACLSSCRVTLLNLATPSLPFDEWKKFDKPPRKKPIPNPLYLRQEETQTKVKNEKLHM
ncbi:hypothetical protein RUM43_000420 [Polyplax serrata]|uniref:Uncharacterized protein n=1 Tax=Polyplax serrata TaxID=468196 RepID=A0AAN8XN36_POLSC